MKKLFITGVVLCSAIILIGAQTGFAWPTYEGGCNTCHGSGFAGLTPNLHTIHAAQACTICHTGVGGAVPIPTTTCAGCHPAADPGVCPLINAPAHASTKATCLTSGCHATACAPTTTTTVEGSTTTTVEGSTTTTVEGTTTTTVPTTDCITIAPNSVTVSGADKTLDVTVTFNRIDIIDAPQEQLDKLVIEVDETCAQYITKNSDTVNIGTDNVTADLNITVQGDAPASTCSIKVSDPESAFDPPLNCTATFTIFSSPTTTTTVPQGECSVSVDSGRRPLRAGLLPSLWRIAIIGDGSNFNRSTAVSIEDINIVIPARVQNPEGLIAYIVIPSTITGFQPGTKAIGVATGAEVCTGTVEIE